MTAITLPIDPAKVEAQLAAKRTENRRNFMVANFQHTRPDERTGRDRLIWTPEMGSTEDLRGPLVGDPAFDQLVAGAWQVNEVADQGEEYVLDAAFRQATQATAMWGALFNDTPVDTDAPDDLTGEPSGNGYGAISWACNGTDFPTLALDSGDFKLDGVQKTFTASGGVIGPVTYFAFLSDETSRLGTDLLYVYMALQATRTLQDGDSLRVTPSLKLG